MAGQVQTGPLNDTHTYLQAHTHTHTNEMDELNMGGLGLGGWQG